jgi:hypothetical protein
MHVADGRVVLVLAGDVVARDADLVIGLAFGHAALERAAHRFRNVGVAVDGGAALPV